jgi:cysteine desulfurase/selenocysteine lyase
VTRRLYLDNAATSNPKPEGVTAAMVDYAARLGSSPGRGAYAEVREAGALLTRCRVRLCELFGGQQPNNVVFTLNASDAINLALHGLLRPGDHVITTWLDHNSILRPLNHLAERGIEQTRLQCDPITGLVDPQDVRRALRSNTRLVATLHGSNVTGTLQPIAELGRITREHGVLLLVDAAQSLGHVPVDVEEMGIDLLAFPGHKGLLGPLGTGALWIRPGVERLLVPLRQGGTGSVSELDVQPEFMPDRFEPGSHNAIGLIGLLAGVDWVLARGIDSLWAHERRLVARAVARLTSLPGVTLYGPQTAEHRCGVFSLRVAGLDPHQLATLLEERYGILSRPGLHCAPLAHQTIGTKELGGTTRLSFGPFVTEADVDYAADALGELGRQALEQQSV